MDLITHIPGVANSALFTPGANTPSPWNVPITGATDGNSPASATRNMAEIYNRVLFALEALVQASGLPVDHANWAQVIDALRSNGLTYAAGAGTANAHTVAYVPRVVALTDGMLLSFKAAAANTGATTLNVSGLGVKQLLGGGGLPLQGGEIVAGGKCMVVWVADADSFVLIECTGASLQVALATKPNHAPQMSQVAGVVGTARSLRSLLNGVSNSTTFTADEVIVESALGGVRYCVPNVNKTINLATVGAGGMDTGTAPNGFTGIYLIYNPITGASALLGTNATAAALPQIYGGANMPAGYTASALISVLATTTASGFAPFSQMDRSIACVQVLSQSISVSTGTPSPWNPTTLPRNAVECSGSTAYSCSAAGSGGTSVFGNSAGLGGQGNLVTIVAGGTATTSFSGVLMTTPQTLYYTGTTGGGTPTYQVSLNGYKI